jgi:hypothetical protein
MSVATPVEIEIELPPQTIGSIIRRNIPAFLGLGFILLLGMTLFLLITRGTIRPNQQASGSWSLEGGQRTAEMIRGLLPWKRENGEEPAESSLKPYRLIPISDLARQLFPEPISIDRREVILGSKAGEKTLTIEHPSVIPRHTRIAVLDDGRCQVFDYGSAAGTWINYQQISESKSHFINDGDIIHIGEAAFRFQIIPDLKGPRPGEEKPS